MITKNLENFITQQIINLQNLGIDISGLELDHFGFQTCSVKDYEEKKIESLEIGELMNESLVGGRRVGIYKLNQRIIYKNFEIKAFELVEPKVEQVCESNLDHIEFVIPESFQKFIEKYSNINFDISVMNRDEFPKVSIKFEDGNCVKFHLKNILEEI